MILGHALAVAVNRFDALYKSKRPPLSLMQLIIMQAIENGKDMYESNIAEKVGLEEESVRLILHRIYKRKFFEKRGSGKLKKLHLTPTGKVAVTKSASKAALTELEMLQELLPEQCLTFAQAMSTLTSSHDRSPSMSS